MMLKYIDNVYCNTCLCIVFTWMSKSVMDLSDWQMEGSKGNPVILSGPFGIKRTVNLNWATFSPKM